MKIWIDFWAPSDPLFFRPIVRRLNERGHTVWITARFFGETTAIAEQCGFQFKVIGQHGGRTTIGKLVAILKGAWQRIMLIDGKNIDIAVSFNSYAQGIASKLSGIPFATCMDYEHQPANHLAFRLADKVIVPKNFKRETLKKQGAHNHKVIVFKGLKENITLVDFKPDLSFPNTLAQLGISPQDILITMRPPATGAAYHSFENLFFDDVVKYLIQQSNVKVLLLPRSESQADHFRKMSFDNLILPLRILDGLNLVYWSDMIVSAGGSMNREAVVLGTPAYTVFRGRMAGVDLSMIEAGTLNEIESFEELERIVPTKKPHRQFMGLNEDAIEEVIRGFLSVSP